jgi:hypothetical protein
MNGRQQIVVMVGPDRCGKTEISQALSKSIGVPYFKASSEHDSFLNKQDLFVNQLRFADTRMVDFLTQTHHSVIFDRAWPCEKVYSVLYERPTDDAVLRHVDSAMADIGAKIVVCYRSNYDNVVDDLDPSLDGKKLLQIEEEYRKFAQWTKCKVHFLNVDDENLIREVEEVLQFMRYVPGSVTYNLYMDELRYYDAYRKSGVAACCV